MNNIEEFLSSKLWVFIWIFNISAFILLPLIIYIIIGVFIFNDSIANLLKFPELMFIAIILYGDALNKSIKSFYKLGEGMKEELFHYQGFTKETQFAISFAILGITISSVLLAFVIIAQYKEFEIPPHFYSIEVWVFIFALLSSFISEVDIRLSEKREKKLLNA